MPDDPPLFQTLSDDDPYIVVSVLNSYTTYSNGSKYKYDVFVHTYAGDLGTTAATNDGTRLYFERQAYFELQEMRRPFTDWLRTVMEKNAVDSSCSL